MADGVDGADGGGNVAVLITAIASGAAVLIAAGVAGLVAWLKVRGDQERKGDRGAVGVLRDHAKRLADRIDVLETHVAELQHDHTSCREQLAGVYGWADRIRDVAVALAQRAGLDPAVAVPPRLARPDVEREEFHSRTLEQRTALLTAAPPASPVPPAGGT